MSEAGFRVFNQTFSLGAGLLYATFLTIFFRPFMAQGKKASLLNWSAAGWHFPRVLSG